MIVSRMRFPCVAALLLLAMWIPISAQAQIPAGSGDSEAFVEASVDRPEPWQGQQIVYTFRYFEAVDALRLPGILVGQPDYEAPDFSSFWQEGEIEQVNYQQTIDGRTYNVSELHTILFPTATGTVTIPPARLILRNMPAADERILETLPVILSIKPLPDGAPEEFSGAVGSFRLAAQVDRTITQVDEPITLRLTLSGPGNIRLAPLPSIPELAGWRILARGEDVRVDRAGDQVVGTRTLDYLLLPTAGGSVTLPAIEYSFFDPAAGAYGSARTDPIQLVAEGAPAPTATPSALVPPVAPITLPATLPQGADLALAPVRVLPSVAPMPAPAALPAAGKPLAAAPWYWALWLAPLAAILVGVGARASAHRVAARRKQRAQARAGADALRALKARGGGAATPADSVANAQHLLTDYLARKLGRTIAGLTRADLAVLLRARGAPQAVIATVHECLSLGDLARFSPSAVDPSMGAQMEAKVAAAIRGLEKVL